MGFGFRVWGLGFRYRVWGLGFGALKGRGRDAYCCAAFLLLSRRGLRTHGRSMHT